MNEPVLRDVTRRDFLAKSGALVVSFTLFPRLGGAQAPKPGDKAVKLPGSLQNTPMLDSWIRIAEDGSITVFTGKAELGQGIKTALLQVAAEELVVEPRAITLVMADTGRTPDERYTAGSQSMQDSATAIRHAAAQVRALLVGVAAGKLGVSGESLTVGGGAVRAPDGRRATLWRAGGRRDAQRASAGRSRRYAMPSTYTVIGQSLPRIDIPPKLAGVATYVQDLRLPGMVHARVVRPPSYGAQLRAVETATHREDAGRTEGREGRTLSRRDRGARVPGGDGNARARQGGELGREACPACRRRIPTATSSACPRRTLPSSTGLRRPPAQARSRPPTAARIRSMARSVRPAPSASTRTRR